jgi:hypothetical protein
MLKILSVTFFRGHAGETGHFEPETEKTPFTHSICNFTFVILICVDFDSQLVNDYFSYKHFLNKQRIFLGVVYIITLFFWGLIPTLIHPTITL